MWVDYTLSCGDYTRSFSDLYASKFRTEPLTVEKVSDDLRMVVKG